MRTLQILSFVSLLTTAGLSSCDDSIRRDEVFCTEEFRSIRIKVSGDSLTDYYTVRRSNADTIRFKQSDPVFEQNYVVLNDNYQKKLENQQDTFRFVGKRASGDVQEDFVISADHCHITKVSGKSEI